MYVKVYEVNPLIKILQSLEEQPRTIYTVLINGVDRADFVYDPLSKLMDQEYKGTVH